ncbi:TspO/MBR family protein [Propionicimonas sp.]|uniref:TspO/MBR family protein n=1 Tax=Propionicimonas sp. TaxID=1955623 RepID=UPI0017C405C8|nr:TspO/MBR family protein [Propionicimonas sp.]MBU3975935.1 tryptophan-rich sensory protein [Actinomycetota bacterium]MBA3020751.1 tryptophan-rich sensory protein [Propionicimonas sp.]MBU3985125.1 tryptophan-rich sensory protein [Actinomycetota bacterium]MBU4008115.1 tryptophan-rich sensory protein [Actinomycetota bacterium]MBU4064671.1 tryptophan-rich sensory protein [Actinomycetota bacterium]
MRSNRANARKTHPAKAAPTQNATEIKGPNKTGNAIFVGSLVSAAAVTGSLATEPDGQWYRELKKPTWQPPGIAFPVVWSGLYTDIAVSSTAVLNELERRGETEEAAAYRKALATNLALNAFWSWLFFRWHHLGAATAGAGVLAISSFDLAKRAGHARPAAGWALGAYALWTGFATVLAGTVCWLNFKDD